MKNAKKRLYISSKSRVLLKKYNLYISGAKEDRTPDPLLAKQVLSQLSYNPMYINSMSLPKMVGLNGLEPATSPLSGVRSSHLSYRPNFIECFNIISTTVPSVNMFFSFFKKICSSSSEKLNSTSKV